MNRDGLRALVEVVELGSVVAAARKLSVARPTLGRRLDELEVEVGVPLLVRTQTGSQPTEAGLVLAKLGRGLLQDEAAALSTAREVGREPRGELRLVAPVGMPPPLVAAFMARLRERYPELAVRIETTDDPVGALAHGVDAAMTFGDRDPGGRWTQIELARVRRQLVASPKYLERAGTPDSFEDLREHELLAWATPTGGAGDWPLRGHGTLKVELALVSPDISLVRQVAALGLGIALVPDAGLPEPGEPLVAVLADSVGDEVSLRLIFPTTMADRPRIQAIVSEARALVALMDRAFVKG
ncbi:MAG: LysR family transcriptional regulator [Myxococcota bacterium]